MPGFSLEILEEKLPDSKFLCECCGSLLRRAKKASCGHFFCSSCVHLLCKNPGRVSVCLRSMRQVFHIDTEFLEADAAFCDELQNLEVHCERCSWRGKLVNFEHHIGTCEFYSYHEKQLEQIEASDQNHCSQTENKSNQLGDIHELQNSNADSYVACQQHLLETCDFTSNCGKEKEQTEDNQQNQCSQEIEVNSNQVDDTHESVLRPKAATCSNVLYYTEGCGSFDIRGKDGNQEGLKEKLSNTTLPSSLKILPGCSAVDAKEEIAPLVKDMTSGNANARNASSYRFPEDNRMVKLEKKVEFLLVENQRLNQEVFQLKNGHYDAKRKIECIEQNLSQSLYQHDNCCENLFRTVDALKDEHATLQERINRFLENPLSREEHVLLVRHVEALRGQIMRIDQRVMSCGSMINDLTTSLTRLANTLANDRVPGVDIQPLE